MKTAVEHYLRLIEEAQKKDQQTSPLWLREKRRRAVEAFSKRGFPTPHEEEWKYTNIVPLLQIPFAINGAKPSLSFEELSPLTFKDTYRVTFVNGHYFPQLSHLPEGSSVILQSLDSVLKKNPEWVEPYLSNDFRHEGGNAFVSLNTAFFNDGAFIRIPRGVVVDKPIHLLFLSYSKGEATSAHPRILIVAEENSQATVIETYEGFILEPYFTNAVTEIFAGSESRIQHYKLQDEGLKTFHLASTSVHQDVNSRFTSHAIFLGGTLSRNQIDSLLDAEGCECTLNGLYLGNGTQHLDCQTRIDHLKPHGTSQELYKGILDGKSRGVFNGRIVVHEEAQQTNARQVNKNLLLSDEAEADPTPQLEILANDVKVSHGSTVGQLDREQIYYLRSRGIDEPSARSLLTYAFASDVIGRMDFLPIQRRLKDALISHLPAAQIVKEVA